MTKKVGRTIFIGLALALILNGCGSFPGQGDQEARIQTDIAQTEQAQSAPQTAIAQTLAADGNGEPATQEAPAPEDGNASTPQPTATAALSPTITPTPTPQTPQVQVGRDTNCRVGPGEPYQRLGGLLVGEAAEVVGRWPGGDYWIIQNPDGNEECWLWGRYATVEGPTGDLPAFTQPPTPTPTFTPQPTFTSTPTHTPTASIDWSGTWDTRWECGGTYCLSTVSVSQSSGAVTGSYTFGGTNYAMSGSLSADKKTWSGTTEAGGGAISYSFSWQMINEDQFTGNLGGSDAWCGYRQGSGAGYPSPCMGP